MKTTIISLESHDDLVSLRDKLSRAKTPRVLLVAPKYARAHLRALDLKVLQRHAESLGAQLGLVTRRFKLRRDAESLGIPVFASAAEAQRKEWKTSPRRPRFVPKPPRRDLRQMRAAAYPQEAAWRTSLPGRIFAFTLGVAAALALAFLFVPRARVTLYPEIKNQSAAVLISASAEAREASITGLVPARSVSAVIETEETLAIKSLITTPKEKAQGIARFSNLTTGEVKIPKGTIVSTSEEPRVRFVALNDALFDKDNKFLEVKIEALEGGTSGNVPAESIRVVEGLLGFSLSVTNLKPTEGGSDEQVVGATEEDRARLRQIALDNLRRQAEAALRAQLRPADVWIPDSLEMTEILEESFSPPEGQPGGTLVLKMKSSFSARYVAAEDLALAARAALEASLPAGFAPLTEEIEIKAGVPTTDFSGATRFEIEASRPVMRTVDEAQVFALALGAEPAALQAALAARLPMRQTPAVEITPAWWKRVPLVPLNVTVEAR